MPILQLPDDLDEAATVVKGWIVQPATLPKCAVALGGPIADLVRRTVPSQAYSPISKKRAIVQETNAMFSAAFPADANQQAGWQALKRIYDAYARLARSIRPSILEALRTMRIPSSRDSQPLLTHLTMMREYGKIAFADIASVEAQDMLFDILIAALTDDPRLLHLCPTGTRKRATTASAPIPPRRNRSTSSATSCTTTRGS